MSAEVETMFSANRIKPWHGLGTILDNPPTAEEAIVAAGLDWEVKSKAVYNSKREKIPNYFANTRSSDDSVLGIVTSRYTIVQNKEAFTFVDNLMGEGLTYESAGSLKGGKQIWLLGRMPEDTILDDKLDPYICFTNTHDGSGSVRVCMTPVRVVCNNTLNLALNTAKRSWSCRHIGNMESKLAEAQQTLGLAKEYTEALKTEAERLAELSVSDAVIESMLDNIYPIKDSDSDIRKKRVSNLKENFFACMKAEDVLKYRGSAYAAMMAVTDFADHSEPMRMTKDYAENRFGQIIVGHPFVDAMYKQILKVA